MNTATQASTETQVTENKGNSENFKKKYNEVLSAQGVQSGARNLAEDVLNILLNQRVPAGFGDINGQIAEAAKRGDVDAVLELSQKLKNLKDNETANVKALADLKKKHTFADVLQAFSAEFEELAYKVSHRTITSTHTLIIEASKAKGTRRSSKADSDDSEKSTATRKKSVIEITTADGEKIEMPVRQGLGASKFKADEAIFEKLGFKVIVEGKDESLEPSVIELDNGTNVPANRNNIFNVITEQNAKMFKGYKAEKVTIE